MALTAVRTASTGGRAQAIGIGRLIAEVAGKAFFGEERKERRPFDDALPRNETIRRTLDARHRSGADIAVLEGENFLARDILEAASGASAAVQMIGIEQHPDIRRAGAVQDLAQHVDVVDHRHAAS